MAERGARGIRSQGCAKRTAKSAVTRVNALMGGDPKGVVLEFEFLSGKMVGVQSMKKSAPRANR